MLKRFEEQIHFDYPNIKEYKLYLAISGGKDSMVLSNLLKQLGLDHTLLHCNFMLRGKEADEDEKFLLTYAKTYDLEIEITRFDTYQFAEDNGLSIQEAARELRYDWFRTFALSHKTLILTAHHLDDSIETFFINLLRGTGLRGIKGIPRFNPPFYRPLLNFASDDIFKYIDQNGVDYKEDSTNSELKYLRNRIRHSILPLLMDIEPKFKTKMDAFFNEMNGINHFLEEYASDLLNELYNEKENTIPINELTHLDPIILQYSFGKFGLKRSSLIAFKQFLESSSGSSFQTNSHEFTMDRNMVFVKSRTQIKSKINSIISKIPDTINLESVVVEFKIVDKNELTQNDAPIQVDYDKVELPLTIRKWEQGDKITPLGMSGKKLVSDVLIDKKIPQYRKQKILIIEDANNKIVGIPNLIINEYFKADQLTKKLLQISILDN